MSNAIIEIKNVNKWFGDFQVLKDINLELSTFALPEPIEIDGRKYTSLST